MKRITSLAITLAILLTMASCNGGTNTPAQTPVGSDAPIAPPETETVVTTGGASPSPTETVETTETTVPVEEPFDAEAFLAECTVYEVTVDTQGSPLNEIDKLDDADKPKKIALRFADAEGLVAYMEQSELGDYFITHIQKNSLDVPFSENDGLYYGNNGVSFTQKSGTTIIQIAGGLHRFSRYHIIKGEEYNFIGNTAAESGYALYVSIGDNGELTYRKYNEKYHVYSAEEMLLAYESEDDFYCEDGTVCFENGVAVFVSELKMTLGEYFNSDNFDFKAPRDRYGAKSFGELVELYKQFHEEGKLTEFFYDERLQPGTLN